MRGRKSDTILRNAAPLTFRMTVGHVLVAALKAEEKSQGGIVLPGAATKAGQVNIDRLHFAQVIACGAYADNRGQCYAIEEHPELKDFPLPPGTIVEHKRAHPWQSVAKNELTILTSDITRWWLPGEVPESLDLKEEESE